MTKEQFQHLTETQLECRADAPQLKARYGEWRLPESKDLRAKYAQKQLKENYGQWCRQARLGRRGCCAGYGKVQRFLNNQSELSVPEKWSEMGVDFFKGQGQRKEVYYG